VMQSLEWEDREVSRLPSFVSAAAKLTCILRQDLLCRAPALVRQLVTHLLARVPERS